MAIPDYTREFPPARSFQLRDPSTFYWVRDDAILYRDKPVKGADIDSFRFYLGSFAKDRKHCYCTETRLAGGNSETFRALNFAFATDGVSVWTMGGKINDADAESFVACDDGVDSFAGGSGLPRGFGKDKNHVYYCDFNYKPKWVRKASAESFVSLNDGMYGKDNDFVFCGAATLPKAKVKHWGQIGGHYSKDDARVFYFNRLILDADYGSFEVVDTTGVLQMAKDKHRYYDTDRVVGEAEFFEKIAKYSRKCGPRTKPCT